MYLAYFQAYLGMTIYLTNILWMGFDQTAPPVPEAEFASASFCKYLSLKSVGGE